MSSFDSLNNLAASLISRVTNRNDYNNNTKSSSMRSGASFNRAASSTVASTATTSTGYDLRRASKNHKRQVVPLADSSSVTNTTNKRKKNHCPPEDDEEIEEDENLNGKKNYDHRRAQKTLPVDEEDELDEEDEDDELYDEMAINENQLVKKEALSSPDEESSSSSSNNNNQREAGSSVTHVTTTRASARRQLTENSSQRKTRSKIENSTTKPSGSSRSAAVNVNTPYSTNVKTGPCSTKKHKTSSSPASTTRIQTRSTMRSAITSLKFEDSSPSTTTSTTSVVAAATPIHHLYDDIKPDRIMLRLDTVMPSGMEQVSGVETDKWLATFDAWSPWQQLSALEQLLSSRCSQAQIKHVHSVCIEPKLQRDFITSLPRELSLLLLTYVRPRDLYKLAQVNKYWYAVANDPILWKNICKRARVSIEDFVVGDDMSSYACSSSNFNNTPSIASSSSSSSPTSASPYNYLYTAFNPFKRAYYIDYNVAKNWCTRPLPAQSNLRAHDDHVITCLKFDGRRCLSGSDDNTLKIWCAKTGQLLHTLTGHTGGVWASQLAGSVCVSGSTDRTVRVWNVDTGECVHVLTGHTSTVRCLALHGDVCVSGSRDSLLRVWNIRTGQCMQILRGHQAAVRCVCFDGKLVVSGSYDFKIRVWNPFATEPGKACLHVLEGHTNRVYSLLFDGKRIVSGSLDTNILVWDAETGRLVHTLTGHTSLTSGMQLKGDILVSGNADSTVKIWSLRTGQCLHTLSGTNRHMSAVTCLAFNDRYVVSSSDDGTVKLWSLETGEFIRNLLALESGGRGGVVWRIAMNKNMLVCAVGSRIGVEETRLILLDFDWPPTNFLLSLADKRATSSNTSGHQRSLANGTSYLSASTGD